MKKIDVIDDLFSQEEQENVSNEIHIMPYFWGAADKRRYLKEPQREHYKFWANTIYPTKTSEFNAKQVTIAEVEAAYPHIMSVWSKIADHLTNHLDYDLSKYEFNRIYAVAQYLGINGSGVHKDLADLSIAYYVTPDWNIEWDGGTVFYNESVTDIDKYVAFKSGRVIVFDAKINHKSGAICPKAQDIRTILLFKLRLKK